MSNFMDELLKKAQANPKTIILPEGNDVRTLEAAQAILEQNIASLILIGNPQAIKDSGFVLDGARIIDETDNDLTADLAQGLYELRKHKGLSLEDAQKLIKNPLYLGAMLVHNKQADGMVCGACHSTTEVLRCALQVIRCAPDTALVSSFFIMNVPDCDLGHDGTFLFSDCGLEINPTAERLAHIALSSAQSFRSLVGANPSVALLSHSTKGSAAASADREKVCEALNLAKRLFTDYNKVHPELPPARIDGELQLDAAIIKEVAQSKAPDSDVAGNANCLIFPDLDAGNIGYKLVQRLAKAQALGPITQGLRAPVNDLSRGCSAQDIVGVVAITCIQAQQEIKP